MLPAINAFKLIALKQCILVITFLNCIDCKHKNIWKINVQPGIGTKQEHNGMA